MTTCTTHPSAAAAAPARGWGRLAGGWLSAAVRALLRERALRRAETTLARLDDRSLADIGLTRDQIGVAVRTGRPGPTR